MALCQALLAGTGGGRPKRRSVALCQVKYDDLPRWDGGSIDLPYDHLAPRADRTSEFCGYWGQGMQAKWVGGFNFADFPARDDIYYIYIYITLAIISQFDCVF